jgi:hypothetical protein
MPNGPKTRRVTSSIRIDSNVRCQRIYPVGDRAARTKSIAELATVGIKLSREQAVHLARALLAATQDWKEIDITAFRHKRRQADGTYPVTVTSAVARH